MEVMLRCNSGRNIRRASPSALHEGSMAPIKATFPAPDHDHDRCAADAIDHAELVCEQRAQKFTAIRRQDFRAPTPVYRALDYLMDNGLVHRIESRNAYLACAHDHDAASMVAFFICEICGSGGEIPAASVPQSLHAAAR